MIQFACSTLSCVQMFLGIGYVIARTPDAMVYSNFQTEYYCSVSSIMYSCQTKPTKSDPFLN